MAASQLPLEESDFELDESILDVLPRGCKVSEATSYSTAAWTKAARVTVSLEDGSSKSYFLKRATGDHGKLMLEGEFTSLKAIHDVVPAFVPEPYAMGKSTGTVPDTYFLLMEFLELSPDLPDPAEFCQRLAEMHRKSVSPTGKFGFPVITCQGPHDQNTEWTDDWCTFYTRLLTQYFETEIKNNGPSEEYQSTFEVFRAHVIPLILKPLQAEGRILKPCLLHGDLWEGNCSTNLETNEPVTFDAASFYGHNELDLAMWRRDISRFSKSYFRQYLRHMPPSEPRHQWDDRNRLYAITYEIAHSNAWPASCLDQRQIILESMRFLMAKYYKSTAVEDPDGIEAGIGNLNLQQAQSSVET